jgi:hypothetical protein
MNLRTAAALAGAMGLVLDTACFTYVPVSTGAPPTGAAVRVELNSAGTTELTRYLGPGVTAVDGTLSSVANDGAVVVAATSLRVADGSSQPWNGSQTVAFPRNYLTNIQLRTLDRRKSTIAAVVVAASLVTVGIVVMRGGGAGGESDNGGPPTGVQVRRPRGVSVFIR